jgi:hypothetical protein
MLFCLSTTVWAGGIGVTGQQQNQGQQQSQGQMQGQIGININKPTNINNVKNTNTVITAVGVHTKISNMVKTDVNNGQNIAPSQVINEAKNLQVAPEVNPFILYPLQGGKFGEFTNYMPKFKLLKPLKRDTDVVVNVLNTYYGYPWNRITLEEVEKYALSKAEDNTGKNVRYSVLYQDSVITSGLGGGAAASGTSNSGLSSSTGSILPGMTKSTANPIFIITFYEVE